MSFMFYCMFSLSFKLCFALQYPKVEKPKTNGGEGGVSFVLRGLEYFMHGKHGKAKNRGGLKTKILHNVSSFQVVNVYLC
jgi:hypothetical protein